MMSTFDGKSVLITGGTGTLGTILVESILKSSSPRRLIVFSRDEHKQFFMAKKYPIAKYECIRFFIGDIRNKTRLVTALEDVDIVIHTAAMKHVGVVEYNPFEAVLTNIVGSQNLVEACIAQRVSKAVIIGTDKAVSPANFYGATKLCGDKLFVVANKVVGLRKTCFAVVRLGNLFGSRGSVVPIFADLLLRGCKTLPVTDCRMTRTTMMPDAAAAFVTKCISNMKGGEIFVPKIPSYRVVDVARAMNPNGKINVIGARIGEKLHEVMISEVEAPNSEELEDCYVVHSEDSFKERVSQTWFPMKQGKYYSSLNNEVYLSRNELQSLVLQVRPDLGHIVQRSAEVKSNFRFSSLKRCFIIAEAGCNHNGDINIAKKLVDIAKDAGADAIKFQTFVVKNLCTDNAQQADYQTKNSGKQESQSAMLRKLELPLSAYKELQAYCKSKDILFFSTPFDTDSLATLVKLKVPIIKIGSGDVTDLPFLNAVGSAGIPVILSTGMSTMEDVQEAYDVLCRAGCPDIAILHCTSNYPAAPEEVNLLAMRSLQKKFGVTVGYSDHTLGSKVACYAVTLGGKILEKHFTYDKSAPGPDHMMSASPEELAEYVKSVREVELLLGNGIKVPQKSELETKKVVTKFVVARHNLKKGSVLTMDVLACKRGGYGGLKPKEIKQALGRKLIKDIQMDTPISKDILELES